jgi:hypothetical protein
MTGRRRWPTLLVLLAPVLLAGCSAIPGWPTDRGPTAETAGLPDGPSWVVVSQGATPSATPTRRVTPRPTPSAGFLPLHSTSPRPSRTPEPYCTAFQRQGQINGLTATPGVGSASASWYNPAGRTLVSYRLTAIPQHLVAGRQAELIWQTITPEPVCGIMTASVTGLKRGMPYILSLDAVDVRKNADGDVGSTVARSGVFYPR